MNVPPTIGTAIATGKATMAELQTVLGIEDLWDILEVAAIDAHNARIIDKWRRRK